MQSLINLLGIMYVINIAVCSVIRSPHEVQSKKKKAGSPNHRTASEFPVLLSHYSAPLVLLCQSVQKPARVSPSQARLFLAGPPTLHLIGEGGGEAQDPSSQQEAKTDSSACQPFGQVGCHERATE